MVFVCVQRIMTRQIVLPIHVAYGGLALFISSLNNIFLLFYVTTYVSVFQIDSTSFYIGEAIFLVWNSINDPLFGWLSDSSSLTSDNTSKNSHADIVLKRIQALSRYGPLFATSFLLFWFHVLPVNLQFSLALCLYDSCLTMVDLHHQALLADLTIKAEDRVKLNSYCSMFSAAGSITVFASFALWDKENMLLFQLFCVLAAVFVCIGFHVCCKSMKLFYQRTSSKKTDFIEDGNMSNMYAVKKYTKQVFRHRNFLMFAVMNLIQVFHCHFNSNFFPLFIQHLLGHTLSPGIGALLLGLSFLVPHLNNLYFLQLCSMHGTYVIIKSLFFVKLILAIIMWCFGTSYWYILCLFIISNRVFTEGTCKLLNLVISDLVDEDFVKFRRTSPVAALVFGTTALLSKPGQTLAPLLGSYLLYKSTGKSIFFNETGSTVLKSNNELSSLHDFKHGCFSVLVFVPIVCAVLQLCVWHFFSLKGKYLQQIRSNRAGLEVGFFSFNNV